MVGSGAVKSSKIKDSIDKNRRQEPFDESLTSRNEGNGHYKSMLENSPSKKPEKIINSHNSSQFRYGFDSDKRKQPFDYV